MNHMGGTIRYPREQAMPVAEELVRLLEPSCERIAIAGSLRRGKPDVGDIEILAVPKPADNLFETDALDGALRSLLIDGTLNYRPNSKGVNTYGPKNKLLVHLPSGIPLDVFSTTPQFWGMSMVVRTGPAEFNVRMMAHLKAIGYAGHAYAGVSNRNGEMMDCPDEETVFRLLNWPYQEPGARK